MSAYVNIKVLEIKFFYFESITPYQLNVMEMNLKYYSTIETKYEDLKIVQYKISVFKIQNFNS